MMRRVFPPSRMSTPNLAPMIDVVMVILIFFMLGTSFALSEGALPAQLPTQVGPGGRTTVALIPTVRIKLLRGEKGKACRISIMGRLLADASPDALTGFMRQKRAEGADPTSPILIEAESEVRYQDVVSAIDACVRAGLPNVQVALGSGPVAAKAGPGS